MIHFAAVYDTKVMTLMRILVRTFRSGRDAQTSKEGGERKGGLRQERVVY